MTLSAVPGAEDVVREVAPEAGHRGDELGARGDVGVDDLLDLGVALLLGVVGEVERALRGDPDRLAIRRAGVDVHLGRGGGVDLDGHRRAAAHEEAIAARALRADEPRLRTRREDRLGDDVRRPRGAADAVLARLDRPDRRVGRERRLDRLLEIDRELDLAELTSAVLGERGERGQDVRRGAAARADDLPAELERAGADGGEAGRQHLASIDAEVVGELERPDPRDVDVARVAEVGHRLGRDLGCSPRASSLAARAWASRFNWPLLSSTSRGRPATALSASIVARAKASTDRLIMKRITGVISRCRGSTARRTLARVPPAGDGLSSNENSSDKNGPLRKGRLTLKRSG